MMNVNTRVLDLALIEALAVATRPEAPAADAAARMREGLFQRVHASLPDYRFIHSHEGEWLSLLEGVDLKPLRQGNTTCSFLLRIAPGARVPPHDHPLEEESLVLEGDVTINGVLCRAGDYHLSPQGKPHDWVTSEGGCLLFVRGAADQCVRR